MKMYWGYMSNEPNKTGRPTVMTEEVIDKLVQAFEDGGNIVQACKTAQISTDTYYNKLKADSDFSAKMKNAQDYPDVIAKMNLVRAMKRNDIDVSKWWAERRMKGEFSTRSELTGKDGEKLEQMVIIKDGSETK